jgi:hypothetical protein
MRERKTFRIFRSYLAFEKNGFEIAEFHSIHSRYAEKRVVSFVTEFVSSVSGTLGVERKGEVE